MASAELIMPDELDLAIIDELGDDGRKPTKTIAEALGVAETTVSNRIRALHSNRIIRVMAQRNMWALGYEAQCFIDVYCDGSMVDTVAEAAARIPNVTGVNVVLGTPQINIYAFTKRYADMLELQRQVSGLPGVRRTELHVGLATHKYRADIGSLDTPLPTLSPDDPSLDELIIRELQIDARRSNREISRVIGAPASTVTERINRLRSNREIRIGVVRDITRTGLPVVAHLMMQVDAHQMDQALGAIGAIEEVSMLTVTAGAFNLALLLVAQSFEQLGDVVEQKLGRIPGALQLQPRIVARSTLHRFDLICET
jgi:Lrp/AsnC family transcriptional regulator for asnA, asnC and gidA